MPRLAPTATVCIDIPIGLSDDGSRACDREARQLLGARRSSVFSVPPRLALPEASYAEINAASKRHCGRGISKQAFYLLPKIREAERLLRSSPERYAGWLETHPELCFCALNGGIPMGDNKKTDAGYRQRRSLLERQISQNMLEDVALTADTRIAPFALCQRRYDRRSGMRRGGHSRCGSASLSSSAW